MCSRKNINRLFEHTNTTTKSNHVSKSTANITTNVKQKHANKIIKKLTHTHWFGLLYKLYVSIRIVCEIFHSILMITQQKRKWRMKARLAVWELGLTFIVWLKFFSILEVSICIHSINVAFRFNTCSKLMEHKSKSFISRMIEEAIMHSNNSTNGNLTVLEQLWKILMKKKF